jgi:hypothetical protein
MKGMMKKMAKMGKGGGDPAALMGRMQGGFR